MGTLAGALAWQGHAGSGSGIARAIACQRPVFDLRAQPPDFSLPAAVYLDKKVQEIVEKKMEVKFDSELAIHMFRAPFRQGGLWKTRASRLS